MAAQKKAERERPAPRTASEGCVLLAAPADAVACSVGGTEYRVEEGVVEVPVAAAASLEPHGFTPLEREG